MRNYPNGYSNIDREQHEVENVSRFEQSPMGEMRKISFSHNAEPEQKNYKTLNS